MKQERKREILNLLWEHFVVMKENPGVRSDGRCSYSEGCAIGVILEKAGKSTLASKLDIVGGSINAFIPAGQHKRISFEDSIELESALGLSPSSTDDGGINFLTRLQRIHDDASGDNYEELLENFTKQVALGFKREFETLQLPVPSMEEV